MRTVAALLCFAPCAMRGRRVVVSFLLALLLFALSPIAIAQDMSGSGASAPGVGAPARGQDQGAQDNRASENVAAAQVEQFYKIAESKEIDGEPLSLERTLNGVYHPNERLRRLIAYWDLASKYATYNLSLKYYNFAQECVGKISNGGALSQETSQLANSARQLATQRRQAARLSFIQAQYDFDAAFTTPAGRRAAINRASYYSAQGGKMIGVDSAVLYIPSALPSTESYNTRYAQAAQVRRMSTEATRLYALLPLLYDSLQTRAVQTQNEFAVLIGAYQGQNVSPVALFSALDNYYDAANEMIAAAMRYNQAIAAYVAQTVPGSVQGATLLATLNQRPGSEQTYRSSAPDSSRAPAQNEGAPNSPSARPPQAYFSPYEYDARYAEVLPGLFRIDAPFAPYGYGVAVTPEPIITASLSSFASNFSALPPAFADVGAQNANTPESLIAVASAQNENAQVTFQNVSYQATTPQTPPESAPAAATPPTTTPEPVVAPETPANPPTDAAPTEIPAEEPAADPTDAEQASTEEQPSQPDDNEPGDSSSDTMAKNSGNARFPLILFVTGYEREFNLPWRPDANSQFNSHESRRSEPTRTPDGAYINHKIEDEELAFFLELSRDALAQINDNDDSDANDVDTILRGQDDQGLSLLEDDSIGYSPNPQAPQGAPGGAPSAPGGAPGGVPGAPGGAPQFGAPGGSVGGAPNGQFGQGAANTPNGASSPSSNATRSGDSAKAKLIARTLFAQSVSDLSDQDKGVYERPISLYDALYNVPANADARYNATCAYWKLQGATARLRVEQTLLTNYRRLYNYARENSQGGTEDSQNRVARQCLSAAFRAEARVSEATALKRATQVDLLQRIGGRVDTSNYPLPSTLPFCGDVFHDGDPGVYNAHMRRTLGVIPQRIQALQDLGATFGSPESLLSLDANADGRIDPEVALAVLEKKRQVALLFIDAELALNFAIAEYVAYFPANVSNEAYVEALIGRGN
ncbi:MAG: hypothetical protein Q4G03_08800 [Planctomycetia bacterium]|nr:hypothetical protein [Planctomycetia bacterium]